MRERGRLGGTLPVESSRGRCWGYFLGSHEGRQIRDERCRRAF